MILGLRAHDLKSTDIEDLCRQLVSLGIRNIQLALHKSFPDFVYSQDSILQIRKVVDDYGIHVCVYGCYIDPATDEGRESFKQHIRYARLLGADMIATESGVAESDCRDDDLFDRIVSNFKEMMEEAEREDMIVGIEPVAIHPVSSPEFALEFLERIGSPNLKVVLDPANLRMRGDLEAPGRAIRLFSDRVGVVHWKTPCDKNDAVYKWLVSNPSVPVLFEEMGIAEVMGMIDDFR